MEASVVGMGTDITQVPRKWKKYLRDSREYEPQNVRFDCHGPKKLTLQIQKQLFSRNKLQNCPNVHHVNCGSAG